MKGLKVTVRFLWVGVFNYVGKNVLPLGLCKEGCQKDDIQSGLSTMTFMGEEKIVVIVNLLL
jgi:hypothetical protein